MARRSLVDTTGHREEIQHLLVDLRWGSRSVARYLELKYGIEIPSGTLRTWRARRVAALQKAGKLPPDWGAEDTTPRGVAVSLTRSADEIPDLLGKRISLAALQEARIRLDLEHELSMGKLFNSTVKEVELLNRIYDSVRSDMQELGLFPRADAHTTETIVVRGGDETEDRPRTRPLGEMLAGATPEDRRALGRSLLRVVRDDAGDAGAGTDVG